jgi:hypothetical protein
MTNFVSGPDTSYLDVLLSLITRCRLLEESNLTDIHHHAATCKLNLIPLTKHA